MKQLLLVFFGGGLGSILRYLISKFLNTPTTGIPMGTFVSNVAGSLIIGFLMGLAAKNQNVSQNHLLFLATGFCGGFTTFSAFSLENFLLLKQGDFTHFFLYTLTTLIIGFTAIFLGFLLVKLL